MKHQVKHQIIYDIIKKYVVFFFLIKKTLFNTLNIIER